jgi:hypothetical protein
MKEISCSECGATCDAPNEAEDAEFPRGFHKVGCRLGALAQSFLPSDTPWTDANEDTPIIDTTGVTSDCVRELERSHNRLLEALKLAKAALTTSKEEQSRRIRALQLAEEAIKQASSP